MITEKQVKEAIEIIEQYKQQQYSIIRDLNKESDTRHIRTLNLKIREFNCLRAGGIKTIGELLAIDRHELIKFRNLGSKGIEKINASLENIGIETEPFISWQ